MRSSSGIRSAFIVSAIRSGIDPAALRDLRELFSHPVNQGPWNVRRRGRTTHALQNCQASRSSRRTQTAGPRRPHQTAQTTHGMLPAPYARVPLSGFGCSRLDSHTPLYGKPISGSRLCAAIAIRGRAFLRPRLSTRLPKPDAVRSLRQLSSSHRDLLAASRLRQRTREARVLRSQTL
jgi:hypothetical protein